MTPLEFNIIYCHHEHDEGEPCNDDCRHSAKCKTPGHDAGYRRSGDRSEGTSVEGSS